MHLHPFISVLKKNRRRGRGWTRALGPEQLLRACEAITVGKGMEPWEGPVEGFGGRSRVPFSISLYYTCLGKLWNKEQPLWWARQRQEVDGSPHGLSSPQFS